MLCLVNTAGTIRLRWLALVALLVLAGSLAGCVSTHESHPSSKGQGLLGYWRWSQAKDWTQPHLVYIHRVGNRYVLEAPPMILSRGPLPVEKGRLVLHFMGVKPGPKGSPVPTHRESERVSFYLIDGGRELAWADYTQAPFTGKPTFVLVLKRATGSSRELAEEVRGWAANVAINHNLDVLALAIEQHAGSSHQFPTRASMLPGGGFWKWKGAPHLRNPLTGGPMVLGSAPGDFSYTSSNTGGHSWKLTAHLYGGATNSQSEWSAQ